MFVDLRATVVALNGLSNKTGNVLLAGVPGPAKDPAQWPGLCFGIEAIILGTLEVQVELGKMPPLRSSQFGLAANMSRLRSRQLMTPSLGAILREGGPISTRARIPKSDSSKAGTITSMQLRYLRLAIVGMYMGA